MQTALIISVITLFYFLTIKRLKKMNAQENAQFQVLETDVTILKANSEKLIAQNAATATKLQQILAGGVTADNTADIQALVDQINATNAEVVAALTPADSSTTQQPGA
jgi:phosphoribosylanthranilate isomerase